MPKHDSDKDRTKPNSRTPKKRNTKVKQKKKKKLVSKKTQYKKSEDSDSDPEWFPGDEEEDMSTIEMQRLMLRMFPSKAGTERLKKLENLNKIKKSALNKLKNNHNSEEDDNDDSDVETTADNEIAMLINELKKGNRMAEEIKKVEDEDDDDDDDYDDINGHLVEDDDEVDSEEIMNMLGQNMKFNIIFTVNDPNELTNPTIEDLTDDDDDTDNEKKADIAKEDSKLTVGDKVMVKAKDWDEAYMGKIIKIGKRNHYDVRLDDKELDQRTWRQIHNKYIQKETKEIVEHRDLLNEMEELIKTRNSKGKTAMLNHFHQLVKATEKEQKKKEELESKKERDKNVLRLRKLFRARGPTDDLKFFQKMAVDAQKKIIHQLREVNKYTHVEKPYRLALLESDIPIQFKSIALKKLNILSYMDPSSGEYYKIKQWVDAFMRIPFGNVTHLPIKITDGPTKCADFMEEARQILDDCVYGLNDAKMQIMQFLGQLIANPNSIGSAIAIQGPPGTGKTTLIKEGISKILKRPFALIALGGATDASFLEGHSYTYEGSSWGKVVDIILNSKTMNPVIYFDELDKISDTPKGEEITGILTHLIDTSQSDMFHDKYFSSISFDMSKALYIFSYNDDKKINPVLKDRMYRIYTEGYNSKEKIVIAKEHLIPKIAKNINFGEDEVILKDPALSYIIETYTEKEKGVRNLKRCLEIMYTKINLFKLMKSDSKLFDGEEVLKITSPFEVTEEIIKKLIKTKDLNSVPFGMYL